MLNSVFQVLKHILGGFVEAAILSTVEWIL